MLEKKRVHISESEEHDATLTVSAAQVKDERSHAMADYKPFVLSAEMLGHEGPVRNKSPVCVLMITQARTIDC